MATLNQNGIKVSLFKEFVAHCGRDLLKNLTTRQVCKEFLIPITSRQQPDQSCSFVEHLINERHDGVGRATVFISHCWNSLFLDIVDTIEYHFQNDTETIVWFDLFCINQHSFIFFDVDWWREFKSLIREIGHTVLILRPWNTNPITMGPASLSRYAILTVE